MLSSLISQNAETDIARPIDHGIRALIGQERRINIPMTDATTNSTKAGTMPSLRILVTGPAMMIDSWFQFLENSIS